MSLLRLRVSGRRFRGGGLVGLACLALKFLRGHWNTAVFAITTQCNCRCVMCGMYENPPEYLPLEGVRKVLSFLARNRFLIVYFTGGEPTLHPHILEAVKLTDKLGMAATLTTNGNLGKERIRELKEAGLRVLSVSLDHWKPEVCEKIRGVKGIMRRQVEAITYARNLKLKVYALVYLNPYLVEDGVEKIVEYVNYGLGVPVGFCYPAEANINTFKLHGRLGGEFEEKLRESVKTLLRMKKRGYQITNTGTYLEDVLSQSEKPNFYCKGGEATVYIDWHGDLYPCFLKPKMSSLLEGGGHLLEDVGCNDCYINCFREPSILAQAVKSPRLLLKEAAYFLSVRSLLF